jgi:hypothetical protein
VRLAPGLPVQVCLPALIHPLPGAGRYDTLHFASNSTACLSVNSVGDSVTPRVEIGAERVLRSARDTRQHGAVELSERPAVDRRSDRRFLLPRTEELGHERRGALRVPNYTNSG